MRYHKALDDGRAHIGSLRVVIGVQLLVIAFLGWGWHNAPKQLRIHLPPDLRSGALLSADAVPPPTLYTFGFYIFQQLNRWPQDGARDYGGQIYRLSPYLTPRYRAELLADLELRGRHYLLDLQAREGGSTAPVQVMRSHPPLAEPVAAEARHQNLDYSLSEK